MINTPSLVSTEDSDDEGKALGRGLLGRDTGSGFIAGGERVRSIFQGETHSGREIVEVSSHRTLKENYEINSQNDRLKNIIK